MAEELLTVRWLVLYILICTVSLCATADAEERSMVLRVGALIPQGSEPAGLREGLAELGYIEGKNLVIEWRGHSRSYQPSDSALYDFGICRQRARTPSPPFATIEWAIRLSL